ncbi:hypothetical protein [Halorussus salinisoli]|uniref:hypothetical protein n=1 Tax=Halorussus salinisoli TaxID=2558242 RepID=UPI0010C1D055|nr:hypothetical protein [Halorussus salinisoli]
MGENSASLWRGGDDSLVVWALASFHTATLVAVLVTAFYLAGTLGDLLGGLDTLFGLGLYLVLWAGTWWTTRRVLRAVADATSETDTASETGTSALAVVGVGGKWGGVNGVLFFWVLFVGFVALNASLEIDAVAFLFVAGGIGTLLALGIGAIVGVVFAVLDLALFRAARGLAPAPASAPESAPEAEREESDETV